METTFSRLILNFIGDKKKAIFKGYEIFDSFYTFDTTSIDIKDEMFGPYKEKKITDFKLIYGDERDNDKNYSLSFKLCLYYGKNKVYCFIEAEYFFLYDICCLDKNFTFKFMDMELKEINYSDDSRIRIVLINSPSKYIINEKSILLSSLVPEANPNYQSIQLSVFDSSFNAYSSKFIVDDEICDEITISNYIKENKNILKDFEKKFNSIIESEEKEDKKKEEYIKLLLQTEIKRVDMILTKRDEILNKAFNDNESYRLIYLYMLWFVCDLLFIKNTNYPISIDNMYKYIKEFYEKYEKDNSLLNYQRVLLFCSNLVYFINLKDVEEYNKSELEYVNKKNLKNTSVFGLSFQFLKDLIDNLNSNSLLFYPFLLLDSGLYYHKGESTYGFDFEDSQKIIEHLKSIIPDVFFVYKKEQLLDSEKGFNFKGLKTVFINKSSVLKGYKGNPSKEEPNIKIRKHYSFRVSKVIMHESFGHNKYYFHKTVSPETPRHFYDKNKKYIVMISKKYINQNNSNENIFYVNQDSNSGESGNFLEYFFGIYDKVLVLDLIYDIPDVSPLMDNVKYFVSESLDIIKNYIIYKYVLSEKKIKYEEKENSTLEDNIIEMEKIIKEHKIDLNTVKIPKREINLICEIKKDEEKEIMFVEKEDGENKNFTYYLKKMVESDDNDESREAARQLIFNFLKKE